MAASAKHSWEFVRRFRRHAFGWKSQPAIGRIKEAVSEIKKVARKDAALGAEGAVTFLEKVSPAIERVDGSSGAIGTAVRRAVDALVPIIAEAPVDRETRMAWLERLFDAQCEDAIPYIESIGDAWGTLCASKDVASEWADRLMMPSRDAWERTAAGEWTFFTGAANFLSALLAAERYDEILEYLRPVNLRMWDDHVYAVRALAAMGRPDDAIRYAEDCRREGVSDRAVAIACEEVLLANGRTEEAYREYAVDANRAGTHLAWFRALAKKYPDRTPDDILAYVVEETPGEEGKWFAAAKSAGLYDEAIRLANRSPCSPQTLTRAARDFAGSKPEFALEAAIAALKWISHGYGYELTSRDVWSAHHHAMKAAEAIDRVDVTRERIRELVSKDDAWGRFMVASLRGEL